MSSARNQPENQPVMVVSTLKWASSAALKKSKASFSENKRLKLQTCCCQPTYLFGVWYSTVHTISFSPNRKEKTSFWYFPFFLSLSIHPQGLNQMSPTISCTSRNFWHKDLKGELFYAHIYFLLALPHGLTREGRWFIKMQCICGCFAL